MDQLTLAQPRFSLLHGAIARDFGSVQAFRRAFSGALERSGSYEQLWLLVDGGGTLRLVLSPRHYKPKGYGLFVIDLLRRGYLAFPPESEAQRFLRHWRMIDWDDAARRYNVYRLLLPRWPTP